MCVVYDLQHMVMRDSSWKEDDNLKLIFESEMSFHLQNCTGKFSFKDDLMFEWF